MALFGKKKEEATCCCGAAKTGVEESCCGEKVDGVCCIKVLGAGCKSCHEQYENAKKAVRDLGLDVEVEYITDIIDIVFIICRAGLSISPVVCTAPLTSPSASPVFTIMMP